MKARLKLEQSDPRLPYLLDRNIKIGQSASFKGCSLTRDCFSLGSKKQSASKYTLQTYLSALVSWSSNSLVRDSFTAQSPIICTRIETRLRGFLNLHACFANRVRHLKLKYSQSQHNNKC